jgi:demethylmenaquinone methyltransferase/2-methoxy-6-polyprenyl-1,4-benzoquinol methylase
MPQASMVRQMFEGVAPRYDLLNRVLSLGIDRFWRRALVDSLELRPTDVAVDLCCGTGDLAIEIAGRARCVACDFTWNMLTRAKAKSTATSTPLRLAAADTLALPFGDERFDAATVAFGIRNLADMDAGLREMLRVLKPGGKLAILEFSHPNRAWLRLPYQFYLKVLLPRMGNLLSRKGEAYRYLAESIIGFPIPDTLVTMIDDAGFCGARYERLSGGIVAIHTAHKKHS